MFVNCQVGGNSKAKAFFKSQPDFRADMSIQEKYNSRAAALYRDKVWFIPKSGPLFLSLYLSSTSKACSIIYHKTAQDGQKVEETLRKDGNRGGEKGGSQ